MLSYSRFSPARHSFLLTGPVCGLFCVLVTSCVAKQTQALSLAPAVQGEVVGIFNFLSLISSTLSSVHKYLYLFWNKHKETNQAASDKSEFSDRSTYNDGSSIRIVGEHEDNLCLTPDGKRSEASRSRIDDSN
jgi:hypothetical protein